MPVGDPPGDPLVALLAGTYVDPETGETLAAAARAVAIEDSLAGAEAELVAALGLGRHLTVVADEDTFAALGDRVARALDARFTVQRIVLDRAPHADAATLARLIAALDPRLDGIVAVGAGTINDLCKLAALARGCPQVVFATAPSMNGYTSLSASLTEGGLKRSLRAATPLGVFFDLGVLAAAPVRLIAALDPRLDGIVAVGAGTINDLCKLAALARGCPQVVFATAPSMNGYTSLSASLTEGGLKRSLRAATPLGVFFDLGVLAAAPVRLIRAGLGDSVCRPTAQADWLLAHLLLDLPYREAPFAILAGDEAALLDQAGALVAGDVAAMRHLVRTLVLSGFGMTICGGSYPASQGEHLISHYIDVMRPPDLVDALHGEQIGVCALAMARVQEAILARDAAPILVPTRVTHDDVIRHFGAERGEACWLELAPKRLDRARTDAANARLAAGWDALRARLHAVTLGSARMTAVLAAAGAPRVPAELGWSTALFDAAITHAREIRNRYTFLDFAADLAPAS